MSYSIKIEGGELDEDGFSRFNVLKVIIDGEEVRCETDHGEPEDNSFLRDWSWIQYALKEAYEQGLEDGKGE